MTPKIDFQPSATATAAPSSRQRSSADASDDPFAACLQNATQQNRQNDTTDASRQNDSQKTQSPQDAQASLDKTASAAKPAWASRRKSASDKKTAKNEDNADSPPADAAEPAATVETDPTAAAATSDADPKHPSKDDAKVDAVAQLVLQPETLAAAVVAVAVSAAQALQPTPQTVDTPKPANPADPTLVDRGASAKIERLPQSLPAETSTDSPTPTNSRPAPATSVKSDLPIPKAPAVHAIPTNSPATNTPATIATTTATDPNETAAVPQPRERPAKDAKESGSAAPVAPHAVSGIKANASQTQSDTSDTSDNSPSDHRPAPTPNAPHFRHAGKAGSTADNDNSSSRSATVLPTQTVTPLDLATNPDISAAEIQVAAAAPEAISGPQDSATSPLAGTSLPVPASSLHSAKSAGAAQDSPASVSDQTYDQVVLGLRTKMDAANQKAEIELNPPNLGKLQVSIAVNNGQLTAQFRTSSDVVRDLLSSKIDHLRSVLEGQGITVDKLAVSTTPAPSTGSDFRPTTSTGTDQHNGRSGGAFSQERQSPRQHANEGFSQMWRAALAKEQPIDLLA